MPTRSRAKAPNLRPVLLATLLLLTAESCVTAKSAPSADPPSVSLVDARGEPVATNAPIPRHRAVGVLVSGLKPNAEVTVRFVEGEGESHAVFESDGNGVVDTGRMPPVSGSWTGADIDGWAWSMTPPPKRPLDATSVRVVVEAEERAPLELEFMRTDTPSTVEVISVREQEPQVIGDLALPRGDGPFPAVLVLGGSEGGNRTSLRRALDLAQEGYAAFALSYFGADGLEDTIDRIPLERLFAGLDWLKEHPKTDSSGVHIIGESRGGELVLLVASHRPDVRGVVAMVPSGLVWGAMRDPSKAAWTLAGEDVPFVPWSGVGPSFSTDADGTRWMSPTPLFETSLAQMTPEQREAATIAVERIQGPVLFIGGKEDGLWPTCALSEISLERLRQAHRPKEWKDELLCFDDVGHRLSVPGGSTQGHAVGGGSPKTRLGGKPAAIAKAEREVRRRILEHLKHARGVQAQANADVATPTAQSE